jgi:hypothetical protein
MMLPPSSTPSPDISIIRYQSAFGVTASCDSSRSATIDGAVARRARKYSRFSSRDAAAGSVNIRTSWVMRTRSARAHAASAVDGGSAGNRSSASSARVWRPVRIIRMMSASCASTPSSAEPRTAIAIARCAVIRFIAHRVSEKRAADSRRAKAPAINAAASCARRSRMSAASALEIAVFAATSDAGVRSRRAG